MQTFQIGPNESGQRLDKFLHKYLPLAGTGFLYKMLRKKNITLNGKKAEGKELLSQGDQVSFFFSDETFAGFRGAQKDHGGYRKAYRDLKGIEVLYEDAHVLILNKPAGILTQKAEKEDLSLNEWMIGYLLQKGELTEYSLETFRPSVANRLDRNTSGIVLCGKSLSGSQALGDLIKKRSVRKYYRTFVKGQIKEPAYVKGFLVKDEKNNKVSVRPFTEPEKASEFQIETAYKPLEIHSEMTYLEVELITGKSHQIRAHLAALGHPLLGDTKYGDPAWNRFFFQKYQIKWQLLHAYRIEFPESTGALEGLSGRSIVAPLPKIYDILIEE